jgi:hypothetical protein
MEDVVTDGDPVNKTRLLAYTVGPVDDTYSMREYVLYPLIFLI